MDYIVITRQEYADFHIKDHKSHAHTLSPDDLDCWRMSLSEEFTRMQKYAYESCNPRHFRLQNKIALATCFIFAFIGMVATVYLGLRIML